ncbi:uncharacterized protein LOC135498728 [Lineus longissimus]|uniref:uncharacterized protein LOC135498728 n=1 Tax=Lineus longissimus TaxID=88925 RepID=UPI002B4C3344
MGPRKQTVDSTVVVEDVVAEETNTKKKKKNKVEFEDLAFDGRFLFPKGTLKLAQTMLNITCISLAATHWHCQVHTTNNDVRVLSFSMLNYTRQNDLELCMSSGQLALAFSVMYLPTTVILFLASLLSIPEKFGGKEIWLFIDLVHDVIATLFLLISIILACVTITGGTYAGMTSFLVSMLFVNMVVYIISAVLTVIEIIGGIETRRKEPRRNSAPPSGQRQRQNEPAIIARGAGDPHDDVIIIPVPRLKQSPGKDKEQRRQRGKSHS